MRNDFTKEVPEETKQEAYEREQQDFRKLLVAAVKEVVRQRGNPDPEFEERRIVAESRISEGFKRTLDEMERNENYNPPGLPTHLKRFRG